MVGLFFLQGASHMVPMERNMLPSEAINHDTSHYDEELVPDLIPDSKLPGKLYCKGFALINITLVI